MQLGRNSCADNVRKNSKKGEIMGEKEKEERQWKEECNKERKKRGNRN